VGRAAMAPFMKKKQRRTAPGEAAGRD
jgi:hypothetical protein